ncbi:MAG: xanthine dehydrogenase accessory protein XdhC [Planctomycetota bacterium]|nr:MAG: xanthine dehydrogenase accessory protein XdhC [Planctomycetota bacterium]
MQDSQEWIERLSDLRGQGRPCAVVVVTGIRGSAPREAGARMIVAGGRLEWGTIGGGNLEQLAIDHATALLGEGRRVSESVVYPLSEKAGQCCGGEVTLFFETFHWSERRVVVFGAGHVAQAIGGLAPYLGAKVQLIDGRSEGEIQPPLPVQREFEVLFIDAPEAEVDVIPASSLVLVMTHSHALDLEILARAMKRGVFPYLGLIGSERKWGRFKQRLSQRGFTDEELARVRCPIGAARTSKEPRAIAISTAAELLEVAARLALEGVDSQIDE